MSLTLESPRSPDAAERADIRRLAAAVESRDGQPPLSDQALTHLGSPAVRHRIARDGDRVVGYAQLDGVSLEVAADPVATVPLLDAAEAIGGPGLTVWSHGHRSVIVPALEERGYRRERVLHQLRRPLAEAGRPLDLPDGVTIRAFVAGADDEAWLRVNAAAFAEHAEQGRWTVDDLRAREAEPWFDAAGFLLAVRGADVLGFHWTKIHPDGAGEVYVIGVAPSAQGTGLGAALLSHGLRHLADRGCREVLLYVDETNTAAMRLYERTGFRRYDADVQWRAP
jgi:mycothiol synthase